MKISFYAHNNDLDQIDAFLKGTHKDEYTIEVYRNLENGEFHSILRNVILVTVSYDDFVKLQPILNFQ